MNTTQFLERLFERAKAEGLACCEAYLSEAQAFEASVNKGEILNYSVSSGRGLGFRALIGGKMGYASTQALDEDAVELLIEGVKRNAALIESADEQFIYAGDESYPEMEAPDAALSELSAEQKLQMAFELEQKTLALDPRIAQMDECVLVSELGSTRIVNSMGLDVSHQGGMLLAVSGPIAKAGDDINTGIGYRLVKRLRDLDLEQVAKEAVDEAVSGLDAAPVASGKYRIALHNQAAASLLSVYSQIFSADNAQKGLSRLRGRENERIASDCVTLMDDPFHSLGMNGAPFDGEGVASYRKPVIEKGVLNTLLHNLKTARKQGLERSTANASRDSYAGQVGVAPSNFYIEPGAEGLQALLGQMGAGLLITELQGLHSGANSISGDFSLSAKGFAVEGGKLGRAVKQITISGNFYQLLLDIERVADDLRFLPSGNIGSPTLLVRELSVAGL